MKKQQLFFLVFLTLLTFCKKNNEFIDPEYQDPEVENNIFTPRLDISDAKAIFTIDPDNNEKNTYKITFGNKVEKVTYINTDGEIIYENPIDDCKVNIWSFLVGNDILIVNNFNETVWNENGYQVYDNNDFNLIDKTTGEVTNISTGEGSWIVFSPKPNPFRKNLQIQKSLNNFYFYMDDAVYKLDQTNSIEKYSPTGKEILVFCINENDYMIYEESDHEYLIRTPTGKIVSLSDNADGYIKAFWLGTDNEIYILRWDNSSNGDNCIDKLIVDGENIYTSNIVLNFHISFGIINAYFFKQELEEAILFIPYKTNWGKSWIFYENLEQVQDVPSSFPEYEEVINVCSSSNYFYMATNDNIYKFDFNLNNTKIFNDNQYQIYAICADMNNNIIFNALRNSDGKYVIGTVDSNGNIEIIDDTLNKEVMYIEFL